VPERLIPDRESWDAPATDAPLADVVVLEEGSARSVRFAGRLLASYGATVIRLDGSLGTGDPDAIDPAMSAYLDAGKLSVSIDCTTAAGTALRRRLEAKSDVVVRFVDPGDGSLQTTPCADGPVTVELSWFGRTGPWANYECDDFLAQHASGMAFTSALRMADTTASGPRAVPGHLAEMVAGLAAATASMVGLSGRDAGTPAETVDISVAESIVSFMRYETVIYSYGWGLPSRSKLARSPVAAPVFQQATADGFVDMLIMQEDSWRALLEVLGSPSWGDDELFATHPLRSQYWDALEPLLQEELAKMPTATLYAEGQRLGVAIAPVNTIAQAAAAPQFAERGFFTRLQTSDAQVAAPGRPFALGGVPVARAAPSRGQHNRSVLVEWLACSTEELAEAGAEL
jgi:crotonobetainyl-CoA:carnitine CoA-transferase CaiB-like acyl-CoA transferase